MCVQALGVADALRLLLESLQLPWLLDEIDELRLVLRSAREPGKRKASPASAVLSRDVDHDLRVLARLRREVLTGLAGDGPTALWAPAPLMSELVRGTTRNVADALVERLHEHPSRAAARSSELRQISRAAAAWTHTYLALLAIEWFSADDEPEGDWFLGLGA
jgi:hypothetical protein